MEFDLSSVGIYYIATAPDDNIYEYYMLSAYPHSFPIHNPASILE